MNDFNNQGKFGRQGKLLVRPYVTEFLKECSKNYQIIIFTAGTKEYADW